MATPTSITPATAAASRDERAVAAAQQAVLEAGVMTTEFVEASIGTVNDLGATLEVILVPANTDTIGATAIVMLDAEDLTVLQVDHYR